ncbi:unnamed protein product [Coffea canephora]|uniref:Protein kinase domain-containing protein n=1 Tax=Coffea canephora TaxID=49390 RepID=A0A068U262_COFCA|nr:unnamed protein product [Coffea canephora]
MRNNKIRTTLKQPSLNKYGSAGVCDNQLHLVNQMLMSSNTLVDLNFKRSLLCSKIDYIKKFIMNEYLICFFLIVGHLASRLNGQQQYSGNSVLSCNNTDKKGPTPAFLYSCNGEKHFCPAFLIFRSQSTYNSPTAISNLTSSSAVELARINNISISGVLPQSREVIVPESQIGIYIGIAVGSSFGILSRVLFLIFSHSVRGKINEASLKNKDGNKMQNLPANILDKIAEFDQELKIYEFEELEAATGNFSPQKKLSDSVYRGVLRGELVAIKRMSKDVRREVKILQKINHFNLISLYGVCERNGVYHLAYEFMENGSVKQWLKERGFPEIQSWNTRIRIALDIANGLDYLHNFTAPAYVHKDINSGNILLNGDLRAKIANFSFAKSSEGGEFSNSSSTTFFPGTKGYMAPEYLEDQKVSPKIDVYAFGVVLLELITGRDAIFVEGGQDVLLSEAVISVMAATDAEYAIGDLIDPCLQVKHPIGYIIDHSELALRLIKLSVACLAREPSERLTMAEVISRLMKIQLDVQKTEYSFSIV